MDLTKIMQLLRMRNVDELALHIKKSRANTYKYGKPIGHKDYGQPPTDVVVWLLKHGISTKYIFGVSKAPKIIIPRLKSNEAKK